MDEAIYSENQIDAENEVYWDAITPKLWYIIPLGIFGIALLYSVIQQNLNVLPGAIFLSIVFLVMFRWLSKFSTKETKTGASGYSGEAINIYPNKLVFGKNTFNFEDIINIEIWEWTRPPENNIGIRTKDRNEFFRIYDPEKAVTAIQKFFPLQKSKKFFTPKKRILYEWSKP